MLILHDIVFTNWFILHFHPSHFTVFIAYIDGHESKLAISILAVVEKS